MYIKKIVLRNFQSHSYTSIELSPKINIFLGKGNRGKSAIIRALKWVFFNEPQGTGFIKKGETFASCSVTLDNDYTIIRERGDKINRYEEKENNLKNYEGVDEKKSEILKIKEEIDKLKKLEDKKNKLTKIIGNFNELKNESEKVNLYYSKLKNIDEIENESSNLIDKKLRYIKLKSIMDELTNNQKELQKSFNELKLYEENEINYERVEEILLLKERYIKLRNIYFQYQKIKKELENETKEREICENDINKYISGYINLIVENGVCPVCYREIDDKEKENIESNIKKMWR